jgi:hypothetical protein
MNDVPQGPGWWQASDGKWYPPAPPSTLPPPPGQAPTLRSRAAGHAPAGAEAGRKSDSGCLTAILFIVVAAVAIGVVAAVVGGDDENDSDTTEEREYAAFDVCTKFVEDRLRSPGTARFRNFFEDDGEVVVAGSDDGPYTVRSSVDSENGFGALLRTNFVCVVRPTGGDNWQLEDLQLDE